MTNHQFGPISGHLARPVGPGPWPALIVIQEWWGLDAQTISIANRLAEQGFLAFAPDLYHGDLAPLGDHKTAMTYMKKHGETAPQGLAAVFDGLHAMPECSGKVGSVGFCFGGRMSLSLGLLRPLNAVCTFYGGQMQVLFDKMASWNIPVLGFFGDADTSIPAGTIDEFRSLLEKRGVEHRITVYPDSGHAFFRDSDPSVYKPQASADAWAQTLAFFARHLKK